MTDVCEIGDVAVTRLKPQICTCPSFKTPGTGPGNGRKLRSQGVLS
jgi:hypothetical protein